ncbi:MAG: tetratricopeptide repeat protein [Blastochloris sp.]|nr:tetratricopeptide repeat protein [Blastochloris sp.]
MKASYLLAESFFNSGQYAAAQERFSAFAQEFKKTKDSLVDFASYQAGLSAMKQEQFKEAVQILETIPPESPAKIPARLAQIRCYMSQNNHLDAIRIADSVLQNRKPDEAWMEASIRKASCYYTLATDDPKKYAQALEIAVQVLAWKDAPLAFRNEAGHLKGAILQRWDGPPMPWKPIWTWSMDRLCPPTS